MAHSHRVSAAKCAIQTQLNKISTGKAALVSNHDRSFCVGRVAAWGSYMNHPIIGSSHWWALHKFGNLWLQMDMTASNRLTGQMLTPSQCQRTSASLPPMSSPERTTRRSPLSQRLMVHTICSFRVGHVMTAMLCTLQQCCSYVVNVACKDT